MDIQINVTLRLDVGAVTKLNIEEFEMNIFN